MYDKTFQARVWPVIISLLDEYIAPLYDGRLSKNVAISLATFPFGIYQSQDAGGKNNDFIGHNGWTGDVTIRSIDATLSGAWSKALDVANALSSGVVHATYDISLEISRPIEFPVEKLTTGSVYTAGIIVSMGIYPKS